MIQSFDRAAGTRQAAQLSFYVLMTFPALLLLAVWILSGLYDSPDVRQDLVREIISNLPLERIEGHREVEDLLNQLAAGAGGIGFATAVVLIYSSSSAISALRHAVQTANEKGLEGPSFPKNKGLDILIMLVTLPVVLVFVALSLSRNLASVVDDSGFLSSVAAHVGGPIGILAASFIFYTWMFWVLNPGRSTWSSAMVGAAFSTAVVSLVWGGLQLWFDSSGGGSAVYGALAAFLGLLLFLNLASMGVVMGAHVAAIWRSRREAKLKPPATDLR